MATIIPATASQLKSDRAYREVLNWIRSGRYSAGDRLPSERELAERMGLNHLTVRRGLARLVSEGVIQKKPNVGNFVAASTGVTPMALVLPEYLDGKVAGHPWTGLLMAGAFSGLDPMRFSLSTLFYKTDRLWEDAGPALINAGVRGVLLVPDSSVAIAHVQRLLDHEIKIVTLRNVPSLARLSLSTVEPDQATAIGQIVHGLVERGHRKIRVATYTCDPELTYTIDALRMALAQVDIGSVDDVMLKLPNLPGASLADTYSVMADVISRPHRPTAIVVPDEFAAADLFQSCYRLGIRVPDELSIASVLDLTPHVYPVPLTAPDSVTVARRVGQIAATQLIELTTNGQLDQRQTLLRNDVVWRESVAPLPLKDKSL